MLRRVSPSTRQETTNGEVKVIVRASSGRGDMSVNEMMDTSRGSKKRGRATVKSSTVFEPAGFFMLRVPLLPLQRYLDAFSSQRAEQHQACADDRQFGCLESAARLPMFDEAVAVASPSLHAAMLRVGKEKEPRKARQTALAISRYFARMTSRPTPFGIFSGVMVGDFDEATNVELGGSSAHRKRTRADMGWLMRLVHGLEQRMDVVRQLEVTANASILIRGGRTVLPYVTQHGLVAQGERTESVSVRFTPVVDDALKGAQDPIPFGDLVALLAHRYPKVGEERVARFLEELLKQEFLLSSLRPPLTISSPLDHVISQLASVEGAEADLAALLQVRDEMRTYDSVPLGEGTELYRSLKARMKGLVHGEEDSPLQVDVALGAKHVRLHHEVGEEVSRAAECLWRLSADRRGMRHLRSYHRDFLERYGVDREVPVLELLDEDCGLGAPPTYTFPKGRREANEPNAAKREDRDPILMRLLMTATNRRETEVELTEELVAALAPVAGAPESAPLSLELYAQVVAESATAIDDGDFRAVIGPNPGSHGAGMSFGRFLDILGPETHERLRDAQDRVSSLKPEAVFADLVYQPRAGRSANVCVAPNWRDHSVVVGTNPSGGTQALPLSDLWIGATLERFYVRSASLDKEVIITANNMLNPHGAPNACRFLYELGNEGVRFWEPFSWGAAAVAPMLPRVRYGRTILSPAQWKVDKQLLLSAHTLDDDLGWTIALDWWRNEWRVPRHVFLTSNDQRILLDLDNPLHLTDLRKEVSGGRHVLLQEVPGGLEGQWVQGPDGPHVTECVFPLLRARASKPVPKIEMSAAPRRLNSEEVTRLPGSDWLFAKLYGSREQEDSFISGPLSSFSEWTVREGLAQEWFYIRYADPDPHLRVRFHGPSATLYGGLLPHLHRWVKEKSAEGVIGRFSLDTYEREVERYGGPKAIELAENLFAADSTTAAALLRLAQGPVPGLEAAELAAISIIDLLSGLGFTFEQQLAWIMTTGEKEEFRSEFRERRRKLMSLADPDGDWETLKALPGGSEVFEAWQIRREALRDYGNGLRTLEQGGRVWSPLGRIVGSLVHMHCNRLLGTGREAELRAVSYARHTLSDQHGRKAAAK